MASEDSTELSCAHAVEVTSATDTPPNTRTHGQRFLIEYLLRDGIQVKP